MSSTVFVLVFLTYMAAVHDETATTTTVWVAILALIIAIITDTIRFS